MPFTDQNVWPCTVEIQHITLSDTNCREIREVAKVLPIDTRRQRDAWYLVGLITAYDLERGVWGQSIRWYYDIQSYYFSGALRQMHCKWSSEKRINLTNKAYYSYRYKSSVTILFNFPLTQSWSIQFSNKWMQVLGHFRMYLRLNTKFQSWSCNMTNTVRITEK